ncbi:O-antigen ligase family protein [bacterium]|nr:O-antigen ligase family protein [bacterium]
MSILTRLLCFETVFAFFLLAGRFKDDPHLAWIPFDLTAGLFVASVGTGLVVICRRGVVFSRRGLYLAISVLPLLAWLSLSRLWSPSQVYAAEKTLFSWTLLFWPLLASALVIAPERERLRRFAFIIAGLGAWLVTDVLIRSDMTGLRPLMHVLGSAYLGLGRAIGLAAIVTWWAALRPGIRTRYRLGLLLLAGAQLFTLMIMGGRGPLLATMVGLLAPLVVAVFFPNVRRQGERYLKATLALLLIATVVLAPAMIWGGVSPRTLERSTSLLTEGNKDHSTTQRLYYYKVAAEEWRAAPIVGHGVGSFPLLIDRGDKAYYPHNLLLEIMVELGLVGLMLLLIPMIVGLNQLRPGWIGNDPLRLLVLALFVNTLVNAQVSEDLTGNRLLFAVLGLMALSPRSDETASQR